MRAIVGAEEDDGVFVNTVFLEGRQHAPDPVVERGHHAGELGGGVGGEGFVVAISPDLLLELRKLFSEGGGVFFRHVHCGVWDGDGQKAEKGALVVGVDPLNGPVHDEIVRVGPAVQVDFLEVVVEPGRIVGVRITLAVVAEEPVETLMDGVPFRAGISQSPLSEGPGRVACFLEGLRNGKGRGRKRVLPDRADFLVASAGCVAGVKAGHDDAPGGSANGGTGIVIGEFHSLPGETVDMGGLKL